MVTLCFFSKLLRKCILQMGKPVVEGSLGSPPFEKPNIEQVRVCVVYKKGVIKLSASQSPCKMGENKGGTFVFYCRLLLLCELISLWLRGCWILSSISSVIWLLRRGRPCMSWVRCFCSVWTTGSWRPRHSSVRGPRKRMRPPTKSIIPGLCIMCNKCMFVDYIHIDAVTSAISCTVTRCQKKKMTLKDARFHSWNATAYVKIIFIVILL